MSTYVHNSNCLLAFYFGCENHPSQRVLPIIPDLYPFLLLHSLCRLHNTMAFSAALRFNKRIKVWTLQHYYFEAMPLNETKIDRSTYQYTYVRMH